MTLAYDFIPVDVLIQLNNGSNDLTSLMKFPENSGVTVTEAYIDPVTNLLVIKIDYTTDIQGQDLTLHIVHPNMPEITNRWTVEPTNQLKAIVYEEEEYALMADLSALAYVIVGGYLGIFFLAMLFRRFIGLELATLIQFGYLSLLQNKEITLYAWSITTWRYIFGYNSHYFSPLP
jgi:hypothetical protein